MLFVSKIKDLRLIRRPADRIMDEQRNPIILKGERVEFSNFRYTTNDPDTIEWLCGHDLYGKQFTSDRVKDKSGKFKPEVLNDQETIDMARNIIKSYDSQTIPMGKQFEQMSKDKKKKQQVPLMIKGNMATAQSLPEYGDPGPTAKSAPSITRDEIAAMIKGEIGAAMAQIVDLIKPQAPAEQLEPAKKVFTCPDCGEKFSSGIAVGAHKKAVHAGPTEAIPKGDEGKNETA